MVKCTGNESALLDCPHIPAAHKHCSYYDYAAVACYDGFNSHGKSEYARVTAFDIYFVEYTAFKCQTLRLANDRINANLHYFCICIVSTR